MIYTFFKIRCESMVLAVWVVVLGVVTGRGLDGALGSDNLQSLDLGPGYTGMFTLQEFIICVPVICLFFCMYILLP